MIINGLVGSESAEKVLLFLANYKKGYAKWIADTFEVPVSQIQKQLQKFEAEGILVSTLEGKTRVFLWNPRYLLKDELIVLLNKALKALPLEIQQKYFRQRMRPRRSGKPL